MVQFLQGTFAHPGDAEGIAFGVASDTSYGLQAPIFRAETGIGTIFRQSLALMNSPYEDVSAGAEDDVRIEYMPSELLRRARLCNLPSGSTAGIYMFLNGTVHKIKGNINSVGHQIIYISCIVSGIYI